MIDDKRNIGRTVVNGNIRFSSVSQIVSFDPRQEGGCPRRWWFSKIDGKKEEETPAQARGKQFAFELERYLKTGYDALSPILRAGKHLLPKPGPDLEVEEELSGSKDEKLAVIDLRDRLLRGEDVGAELRRRAGLSVLDVPFIGAADYRHYRNEYVDEGGVLRREDGGKIVAEIGDHKTTSRISDHRSSSGKVYEGYAKTAEEIAQHPQWLGYGVHAANRHPELTHVRLSGNYYQTKNGLGAAKRTSLISVDEVRTRFYGTIEPVMREMLDVAKERQHESVPFNLHACRAYNKDCPHASYCNRPAGDVSVLLQTKRGETMTRGLFDDPTPTNGAKHGIPTIPGAPSTGLFAAPAPPLPDAEREAVIKAERERLQAMEAVPPPVPAPRRHPLEGVDGYVVGQPCNSRGFYVSANGQGFIAVETGHACASCVQIPVIPMIGSINPADAPAPDHIASSDPLTAEAIAEITNPALRAKAEAHAKAHAERRIAEEAAKVSTTGKKTTGCPGSGQRLPMGDKEKLGRKTRCPGCGKDLKIKDGDIDMSGDPLVFVVPKHRMDVPQAAVPLPPPPGPKTHTDPSYDTTLVDPPTLPSLFIPAVQRNQIHLGCCNDGGVDGKHNQGCVYSTADPATAALPQNTMAEKHTKATEKAVRMFFPEITVAATTSSTLYLDVVFVRGESPKNLDEYARDLVKTLCAAAKVEDLRYVPDGHELGFGRWKGALQKMVKTNPLPPGEYVLYVGTSDARAEIADAVADMLNARVVRGAL